MKCAQGRRLFGAYWDDQTTQAEREWLESHFVSCASCRDEYEQFSRALELAASLPRVEAAPDLLDRVLARSRRAAPISDRVPTHGVQWVPVTAAAALLLVVGTLVSPWMGLEFGPRLASRRAEAPAVKEPMLVPTATRVPSSAPVQPDPAASQSKTQDGELAAVTDSLFNHSEDVEFILDPVTLHRGRATVMRLPSGIQAERTVITF